MDEKDFLDRYLTPSDPELDPRFVHRPIAIDGFEDQGRFLVQGELGATFSTNVIFKKVSGDRSTRLIEVYKNTQNRETGIFVRLVGSMSLVKVGFPILFLDAAITNVSPITAEKEALTTRVVLHLPQARTDQRRALYGAVSAHADAEGIAYREIEIAPLPAFWGPIWVGESRKLDLEFIGDLRLQAGEAYQAISGDAERRDAFDYRPVAEHLVFNNSLSEHLLFRKMGLEVPLESQAAFFAAMVSGIEALSAD